MGKKCRQFELNNNFKNYSKKRQNTQNKLKKCSSLYEETHKTLERTKMRVQRCNLFLVRMSQHQDFNAP